MNDANRSQPSQAVIASDQFLRIVKETVDFGPQFPDVNEIKSQIVKLTVLGDEKGALQLLIANSTMVASAASELIELIGTVADHVHYTTGLRP